jgi:UDP-3-O-acyl-N-acetylglucosamine deacetylase
MKHKIDQTFIALHVGRNTPMKLKTIETTKHTVVFQNLDVPNGKKIRVMKKQFTENFKIIES